jgi:hypothetical protein
MARRATPQSFSSLVAAARLPYQILPLTVDLCRFSRWNKQRVRGNSTIRSEMSFWCMCSRFLLAQGRLLSDYQTRSLFLSGKNVMHVSGKYWKHLPPISNRAF